MGILDKETITEESFLDGIQDIQDKEDTDIQIDEKDDFNNDNLNKDK